MVWETGKGKEIKRNHAEKWDFLAGYLQMHGLKTIGERV